MTKIICITGLKRHGKGEVGAAIERLVPGAVQVGFADSLKVSMMRALGFDRPDSDLIALADEAKVHWNINITSPMPSLIAGDGSSPGDFERWDAAIHTLTGRELLQWFGTEGGRKTFGDSFWIDQVLPNPANYADPRWVERIADDVAERYDDAPVVAITDCRFDNEAQRALDCGGEVWEVIRPQLVDSSADTHESEAGVDPALITTTIINDAGLDTLEWHVEQALELAGVIQPS